MRNWSDIRELWCSALSTRVSVDTAATQCLILYTNKEHGEGKVGISESVVAAAGAVGLCKVLCWLPLIASRNTPFLPSSARQTNTHCCTVAYKVPTDNASPSPTRPTDRPSTLVSHWSWSAVNDVTIIDHLVKWSRQALVTVTTDNETRWNLMGFQHRSCLRLKWPWPLTFWSNQYVPNTGTYVTQF